MKKYFALALMLLAASCANEALNQNVEEPVVPESAAAPVLYASFESNDVDTKTGFTYDGAGHYDHYWNAGDHIYVFPKEDRYDIYNCTDATNGTFALLKDRTGSATSIDKIYAIYSSELIDDGNAIDDGYANMWTATPPYIATPISWNYTVDGPDKNGAYGYNNIMVAAIDDPGEKLVFKSTVGWLRLQLKGTQKVKSIMITSLVGYIFPISMSEVYVTNMAGTPAFDYEEGLNGNQRKLSISAPYAQLNTVTATDFYITLPPCTMSHGFQLTIEYADGTSQTINTSDQEYVIKRNVVTKLPERTVGTTIANLSASGTANCYIVQSSGNKKINASVKGNSLESVGTPVRAGVLWESFNTNTAPSVGALVMNVTYLDGDVYFRVPSDPSTTQGNAVIAVYDSSDNILWSWHIWITGYSGLTTPIDLSSFVSGFKVMPLSLGVLESAGTPLYYQWGRKDPFYRYATFNLPPENVVEGTVHPTPNYSGYASVATAINHPTTFYYGASNSSNWDTNTNSDRIDLWRDDTKTIYDPCPYGWKVMSGSNISSAIDNGLAIGTLNFGSWGSLAVAPAGSIMAAESYHWTSHGWLNSGNLRLDYMNHQGALYQVGTQVSTSGAFPVRCEKM